MNKDAVIRDEQTTYLFMIVSGPSYDIGAWEWVCTLLSQRFRGEMWAYGSYAADRVFGQIRLHVVQQRSDNRFTSFCRYVVRVVRRAYQLRRDRPGSIVVTSYDPLRAGLLALCVARILGARLVCEVNGAYGNPDNLANVTSSWWKRVRLAEIRLVGSYVLRRADGVRLLFREQLRDFVTLPPRIVVRQFFALCNVDRFAPGADEPIVLAAGFPFLIKGMDVLVSAFRQLAPRFPGWKLVLIGHGIPAELRARGLHYSWIETQPGLPQTELARWVSRCSILALPSRSEAMGRILIEAAVAGKCRVASRVGGIPTVIDDGRDGMLVEKEDVAGLARALEDLMRNEASRRRLGEAARQRAVTEFSPAVYLEHYAELIRATLARQAPAARAGT
jgi:glycosyltransferase involved in cell wall biosynthesis